MPEKIGIITFHRAENYGAFLQAYALQTILREQGHRVEIIDYAPKYLEQVYKHRHRITLPTDTVRQKFLKFFYGCYMDLLNFGTIRRRQKYFASSQYHCLNLSPASAHTFEELSASEMDYTCCISGSDQIWNPKLTNGQLDPAYFLAFVPSSIRSIAYAVSMGSPSLEPTYRSELQKYLQTYTNISVREGSATPYLEQLSKRSVVPVLDPTLLLTQKHWNNFFESPRFSENLSNFIFVYSLAGPFQNSRLGKNSVLGLSDRLRKTYNLKRVIYVGNGKDKIYPKETYIPPEEFPWYFAHAAFVVTDSYHGTIFSLINKTPFYTIQQESNNTRVADLLTSLGLRNRLVSSASEITTIHSEIDWDTVEKKLTVLRTHSLEYLTKAVMNTESIEGVTSVDSP
ncbi:MAG: polysaccharide pyruvyl transferase family protein [Methanocorpusculum sp.]|nr:polysaccharide pyruvyl transferase family protein [Methanocorpusculum sp.]MDE2521884.1 polysaccharide pyruvyl transferase family protein [Methanocorpusculum sp.]MDE2524877.1 polysaccharide pyruvyl transferase family protein [Methanocorpusculum sp.]